MSGDVRIRYPQTEPDGMTCDVGERWECIWETPREIPSHAAIDNNYDSTES